MSLSGRTSRSTLSARGVIARIARRSEKLRDGNAKRIRKTDENVNGKSFASCRVQVDRRTPSAHPSAQRTRPESNHGQRVARRFVVQCPGRLARDLASAPSTQLVGSLVVIKYPYRGSFMEVREIVRHSSKFRERQK